MSRNYRDRLPFGELIADVTLNVRLDREYKAYATKAARPTSTIAIHEYLPLALETAA